MHFPLVKEPPKIGLAWNAVHRKIGCRYKRALLARLILSTIPFLSIEALQAIRHSFGR